LGNAFYLGFSTFLKWFTPFCWVFYKVAAFSGGGNDGIVLSRGRFNSKKSSVSLFLLENVSFGVWSGLASCEADKISVCWGFESKIAV